MYIHREGLLPNVDKPWLLKPAIFIVIAIGIYFYRRFTYLGS